MRHQKDHKTVLVEYVASLSDEDLRFLGSRLTEKFGGDLAAALNLMSNRQSIDGILGAARGAEEVYQLCDVIRDIVVRECKKRKTSFYASDR